MNVLSQRRSPFSIAVVIIVIFVGAVSRIHVTEAFSRHAASPVRHPLLPLNQPTIHSGSDCQAWSTDLHHKPKPGCRQTRRLATITSDSIAAGSYDDDDDAHLMMGRSLRKTSKVPATTFSLVKAIVGSGVLALPSGVAALGSYRSSLEPAIYVMLVLGVLSSYTFGLYGRLVHTSGAKSLGEAWEKEKGKATAWIPSVANMAFCFGAALSYSILLGDAFSALAQTGGISSGIASTRQFWILLVTGTVLLPLCQLKSLLALAPLSVFGVFAVLMTTLFLGIRCPALNALSPYAIPGGSLLSTLTAKQAPLFNASFKGFLSPSAMILGGMSAAAYLGHFSAPGFYHSLQAKTANQSPMGVVTKLDRINKAQQLRDYFQVTLGGFAGATLINCLVMSFGFLTFGGNSLGVILNNFSTMDMGASLCRLLMAVCVIGGFPFLVSACRGEVLEFLKLRTGKQPSKPMEKRVTSVILAALTAGSLVMKDAGFVIGFVGSVMGSLIVYVFPALLFLTRTQPANGTIFSNRLSLERLFCRFLVGFGMAATVLGGTVSVVNNYFPHLLL